MSQNTSIVRSAIRKAGINAPTKGARLLRHSAATTMLRGGATLDMVGAVLRHRSPDMTAHYAKVDVNMLQQIAQPWPGDA
jgi:integrase/recombinase XerD